MRHLVIGSLGEVGAAIGRVLLKRRDHLVVGVDRGGYEYSMMSGKVEKKKPDTMFDVLHVCIPYTSKFHEIVREYAEKHLIEDGILINHSSVPIGTSDKLRAVHSPVRGIHPYLYEGICTFVKYFGGKQAPRAAAIFESCGIKTCVTNRSDETEALKLWDTTYYGWNIVFQKILYAWCEKNGMPFDMIYRDANRSYNKGYLELGKNEVQRPVLKNVQGKIGGHCVIQNCALLESEVARIIEAANEQF